LSACDKSLLSSLNSELVKATLNKVREPPAFCTPSDVFLDAEECLGAIFQSLRDSHVAVPATGENGNVPFEKYVMGEMTKE
jgi:hypothetical protein